MGNRKGTRHKAQRPIREAPPPPAPRPRWTELCPVCGETGRPVLTVVRRAIPYPKGREYQWACAECIRRHHLVRGDLTLPSRIGPQSS